MQEKVRLSGENATNMGTDGGKIAAYHIYIFYV
jgi:hypothetical protein